MSIVNRRQCPSCEQLVPLDVKSVVTRSGHTYHEACAKEIAELYIAMTMKSEKPQRKAQKKNKKKKKDDNKTDPSA